MSRTGTIFGVSRLRCGFLLQDLTHRYGMSPAHISRIWTTWITFLHHHLRALPIWPSRQFVDDNMPTCFKQTFPKTRVIIDCTEFLIEMPSFCLSPNYGYPSFVSSLYVGRTSDKKLTNDCGILTLLEEGDQLMADRGFDIEGNFPVGVTDLIDVTQ